MAALWNSSVRIENEHEAADLVRQSEPSVETSQHESKVDDHASANGHNGRAGPDRAFDPATAMLRKLRAAPVPAAEHADTTAIELTLNASEPSSRHTDAQGVAANGVPEKKDHVPTDAPSVAECATDPESHSSKPAGKASCNGLDEGEPNGHEKASVNQPVAAAEPNPEAAANFLQRWFFTYMNPLVE